MRRLWSIILTNALLIFTNLISPQFATANATFEIVDGDSPGEGFNDSTPAAPVGGNTGTTLGQQRLNAFQHAASIWGNLLDSPVIIRVEAQFDSLACTATSGVLGSATPISVARNFTNAPVQSTWYPIALANSLFGGDLAPTGNDIRAVFSSTIGTPGCLESSGWYFGLDGNAPANRIDFVTVLLHELGHGLGFLTFVDLATGIKLNGFDDAYMRFLEDHTTGKTYPQMSDAERVAASIHTGNLHWTGAEVVTGSGGLTAGRHSSGHVQMYAPNSQDEGSSVSHFDTALSPDELMEPFYAGPQHNVGLSLELFQDLGWGTAAAPVVDTTPPSTIADLQVVTSAQGDVTLNWTAPGDDDDIGTATSYDLRFSTTKFTEADWSTLTQVPGEPAPAVAGSFQSNTVNNLLCARFYFFAIKTRDEQGNESALSNIANGKTTACNKLAVTPKRQSPGEVGVSYDSGPLTITGAPNTIGPFSVEIDPATLPVGITYDASQQKFAGTPAEAKLFTIAGVITDGVGSVLKAKFKLKVATAVEITNTALKAGKAGVRYNARLKAKGGIKAYRWSQDGIVTLPGGAVLGLDAGTGKITVLAPVAGPPVSVTFRVTDAAGGTDTQALILTFN